MTTLTFSHGIVSHSTTTGIPGDPPNFLVISGDKIDLHAPLDQSLVSVFAHRDSNYLLTLQASGDISSWGYGNVLDFNFAFDNINGGGSGNNEYYLWVDIDRITGATTYGHSNYEPSAGVTPSFTNATRPDDVHWFDTSVRTMKVWRKNGTVGPIFGNWVEVIRLFVAKYIFSASFVSLSLNSPSFIGTTSGLVGSTRAGSLIFDVIGNPVIRTDSSNNSVYFTTEDVFTSGLPATASPVSGNRARYETFLVDAIGQAPAPAYSIVKFDDFNKVVLLDVLAQGSVLWGLIEFAVGAAGDLVQVTMSGVVRNPLWNWSTIGQQIFVDKDNDGLLITVEDDNYVPLPNQLPVGIAIDKTSILIRRPELALTTGGTGVTDHNALTSIGVNDHDVIDTHIANTNIHSTLTVGEVNGSPLTSVLNVDTINFNSTSGFNVIDQSGGVVQIDLNSSFNPLSISASSGTIGGDATMTASGEEEFRFIAGANITLTGDNSGSPKSITIAASGGVTDHTGLTSIGTNTHAQLDTHLSTSGIHTDAQVKVSANDTTPNYLLSKLTAGTNITLTEVNNGANETITIDAAGGGGSSDSITDADGDTRIRVEAAGDEDVIRFDTGDNLYGFSAQSNIVTISSDGLTVNMGDSDVGYTGAPINITAGNTGSGYGASGVGGAINIRAGEGEDDNGGLILLKPGNVNSGDGNGGNLTMNSGNGYGSGNGGTISMYAGTSTSGISGAVDLFGGAALGSADGGRFRIRAGQAGASSGDGGDLELYGGSGGSGGFAGTGGDIILHPGDGSVADGSVIIANAGNDRGQLRFRADGSGNYIALQATSTVSVNRVWTLPDDDPSVVSGQFLTTDASGILSFAAVAGGTSRYEETGGFTASVAKTITHNLGNKFVVVQIYDNADDQIDPQLIHLVDANSLQITLNATLSGVTVIVVG